MLTKTVPEETSTRTEERSHSDLDEDHIKIARVPGPPVELRTAEELVSWAEVRQKELVPRAIQELDYQLRYGTEKARREIAFEIKKSVGLSAEKSSNVIAPIIVINAREVQALPWAAKKKMEADGVDLKSLVQDSQDTEFEES